MNYIEFAQKIKEKYPEYKDVDDLTLSQKIVEKYPEYKEQVTFEEVKNNDKKGIDLTPSGLYKNALASVAAAPLRMAIKGEDYKTARENALAASEKNKPLGGVGDFIADLAVYSQIPALKGGSAAARFVGNAALQGGVPAAIESLKRDGSLVGGAAMGTGIASLLQGIPYIGRGLSKPAQYLSNKAVEGLTDLKPETLKQVIKPISNALDLTEKDAQNLLMNTTERVRNNYNSLLNRKGDAVGNLLKELPENKTFKAEELNNLYDSILNNYSLSKNPALNPARNATSKELGKIQDLLYGDMLEKGQAVVNPKELYDINKNVNNMIDWDKPSAALKNDVLEQIYLANAKKISDLSPELKAANRAYAELMDFKKNEGIRRIINNSDNIDTASSALKNYNSTVTKGNTNRNIQDLEKLLTDNGFSPFLNDIDDVNAAMDLLTQPKTGRNFLGAATIAKGLVTPVLKGIRGANRKGIPEKLQNIKELLKPLGQTGKGLGAKAGANMLYGGVEYNDYQ